jgi:zinc protease
MVRALGAALAWLLLTGASLDLGQRVALPNGFEAYVEAREGAPLVALLVAVKAGSRHETSETRGAAHLLEHLVFEGSTARGRDEIFRWVYGIGGYLNGFTRDDFTGYVIMGPPAELPAMAGLLAELLSSARLEEGALEGVKPVVIEELRQSQADPTYADEVAFRAARYAGTPYAEPPLGTEASIRAVAVDDLARFYRSRYTPDNMVALVVGGAPAKAMADAVRTAFGRLARTREAAPATGPPAGLRVHARGAVLRAGAQPVVRVAFTGPGPSDPALGDFLALGDLLAGPASPLPHGMQAQVRFEGAVSTLEVAAPVAAGTDPEGTVARVVRSLTTLRVSPAAASRGARHARLEAARLAERIHYFAMARAPLLVAGRADLALGGPSAPGPSALRAALDRALGAGYTALLPAADPGPTPTRSPVGQPRETRLRDARLPNGLTVAVEQRPGSPLVGAHVLARGRLLAEPEGLAGAVEILHQLLRHGPLPARLTEVGATLTVTDDPREPFGDFYFSRDFSGIRLEALARDAEVALGHLADALAPPVRAGPGRLAASTVAAARAEVAALADWRAANARPLAEDRLFARLFDGAAGGPPAGTPVSFSRATASALAAFRRAYFAPGNLILTIVGGEATERLIAMAERTFGRLESVPPPAQAEIAPAARPAAQEALRIRLPGITQGQVRAGLVVETRDPRERAALQVAVGMLGATLFSTLRDAQGLAYSVSADLSFVGPYGLVTTGLGTAPPQLDRALAEIRRLTAARAEAPVSPDEIARRARAAAGRYASRQLASATRAYYLGAALAAGLPHRYGDDYARLLASVTPAEVEAIQRRAFSRPLVAVIVE